MVTLLNLETMATKVIITSKVTILNTVTIGTKVNMATLLAVVTDKHMRYKVLTAASMKMIAFWDMAPCSLVEVDGRFRGAYCLRHRGGAIITAPYSRRLSC
jgi:hypothetical protein